MWWNVRSCSQCFQTRVAVFFCLLKANKTYYLSHPYFKGLVFFYLISVHSIFHVITLFTHNLVPFMLSKRKIWEEKFKWFRPSRFTLNFGLSFVFTKEHLRRHNMWGACIIVICRWKLFRHSKCSTLTLTRTSNIASPAFYLGSKLRINFMLSPIKALFLRVSC